jgi:hypothetical protein
MFSMCTDQYVEDMMYGVLGIDKLYSLEAKGHNI